MQMIHMAVRMARYKIQNLSSAYFFTYLYSTWIFQSAKENPQNIRFFLLLVAYYTEVTREATNNNSKGLYIQ